MHICFVATEIFAWGKYGGFGRATRKIARLLSKRGLKVSAIVPRRDGQPRETLLDGIRVLGFDRQDLFSLRSIYAEVEADLYHSQEPSFGTYLAQKVHPQKVHVVTFRDTRTLSDWLIELRYPSQNAAQVIMNKLYEDNFLVRRAVRNAQARFGASHYVSQKAKNKYRLHTRPDLLPTPVKIPHQIEKAPEPTVCFLSRWDRRKRPEMFFELASSFPDVNFIALGKSRDQRRNEMLHAVYGNQPNLKLEGFINQFESEKFASILQKSWILVNTSIREGLPNAFVEAAASGCAILSAVNPDNFASQFGVHVRDENFAVGLRKLLQDGLWKTRGQLGRQHVREVFAEERAIDQHLEVYERLIT